MRQIFTSFFLLFSLLSFAQPALKREPDLLKGLQEKVPGVVIVKAVSKNDSVPKGATRITICRGMSSFALETEPLIVIDGVFSDTSTSFRNKIVNLDPNDIESFNILKGAVAASLYGYRAARGVIIITTKNSNSRKFIIKDFLDGSRIAGATVSFISEDKKEIIKMAANDSGIIITDKLSLSGSYTMKVSAIGHKTLSFDFKNNSDYKEREVLLEREIKSCSEVVVSVINCYRAIRCGVPAVSRITTRTESAGGTISLIKIFPNPVQKGSNITIESVFKEDKPVFIKIISPDGSLLFSQSQKASKGVNRFNITIDPRWSAGIYFVQLYENGKMLASDKVIIQ